MTAPDPAPDDPTDNLSRNGAEVLVERLTAYWLEQGQGHTTARFWIEHVRNQGQQSAVYVVRSNLVGGRPPRIPGVAQWR